MLGAMLPKWIGPACLLPKDTVGVAPSLGYLWNTIFSDSVVGCITLFYLFISLVNSVSSSWFMAPMPQLQVCSHEWCVYYLRSSGGVRICPSWTASNVKIRPRHITNKWEGHGPSLSVGQHKKHIHKGDMSAYQGW